MSGRTTPRYAPTSSEPRDWNITPKAWQRPNLSPAVSSPRVQPLNRRVKENADILLQAYRTCAEALQSGQVIAPAAEWLLDNFHLVEQQLRQIHDDLPPGFYRQLPKLAEGPFAGYPRVFGLTWAYVAHSDSLMSGPVLKRYVMAYQQVQPLMIGELWAVAITLRIVLIENMRRLAQQIVEGHALRLSADAIVDAVFGRVPNAGPIGIHAHAAGRGTL